MRKLVSIVTVLLAPLSLVAQDAGATSVATDPMIPFYLAVALLFLVALLVIVVAAYMLQVLQILTNEEARKQAEAKGIPYVPEPSWWAKFMSTATDAVPVEKEATVMLDHNYDGIRELDNHLPPWWKWLFYVTIAFAAVYLVFYHVVDSWPLQDQEYLTEVQVAQENIKKFQAANPVDEKTVTAVADPALLAEGKKIYLENCAACHLADGGGDIGPNLTDKYWKHGGSINNVFTVVKNGVTGTNMVAWGSVLSPQMMQNVSSYVLTLQGTTPAKAKAPEGNLYEPGGASSDSVKVQAMIR